MSLKEKFKSMSSRESDEKLTIFHGENDDPVLKLFQVHGPKLNDEVMDALKMNITSVLNGDEPGVSVQLDARQSLWHVAGPGLICAQFSQGKAHDDRTSVYVKLHGLCPTEKIQLVRDVLAGGSRAAMGKALDLVTLAGSAQLDQKPRPAPGLHH